GASGPVVQCGWRYWTIAAGRCVGVTILHGRHGRAARGARHCPEQRMKRRMWTLAALLSSAALVAGIGAVWVRADVGPQQTDRLVESDSTRSGDELLPMPAMIRRFQATLHRVNAIGDGSAASRDALVEAFAVAVEDSSAARLHRLRLDAAEFGWLYFPESRYTTKP